MRSSFLTGFTRITDTQISDRSEVYNVSIFHHLWPTLDLTLTSKSENPYPRKVKWFISRNQSIYYIRAASLISESSSCCISYPSNLASPSRPSYLQYYSLIHYNKAWPGKEEENSEQCRAFSVEQFVVSSCRQLSLSVLKGSLSITRAQSSHALQSLGNKIRVVEEFSVQSVRPKVAC